MKNVRNRASSWTLGLRISFLAMILLYFTESEGLQCDCSDCDKTQFNCETESYCFTSSSLDKITGKLTSAVGCMDGVFPSRESPITCNATSPTSAPACCGDVDYCNQCIKLPPLGDKSDLSFIESPESYEQENGAWSFRPHKSTNGLDNGTVAIVLALCTLIIISVLLCLFFFTWLHCCKAEQISSGTRNGQESQNRPQQITSDQIIIMRYISKGGFSEVFVGVWKKMTLAVKNVSSRHGKHWRREVDIYKNNKLRHNNILRFMGDLLIDDTSCTQLYIFTEYHPIGSLYDCLQTSIIDTNCMLKMLMSMALGLEHLHNKIAAQNKPAMAHRDIKSKNVLVKLDETCVIADLGQAVTHDPKTNSVDVEAGESFGTVRYLSPEILNHQISHTIEGYQCADVYALALTMWEVASCCSEGNIRGSYLKPFHSDVMSNPSLTEMHRALCIDHLRPTIPEEWKNDRVLRSIGTLLRSCWVEDPSERPNITSIVQDLKTIREGGELNAIELNQ